MAENPDADLFAEAPVSHILPQHLNAKVVLCSGEVEDDLLEAFKGLTGAPTFVQQYRCYKVWKFERFTLILAGIGTGTLEPLLWEILTPGIVRQAVLIGTAGAVRPEAPDMGKALPISKAWACGTGIDNELGLEPALPRWPLCATAKTCTIASSDFFYGYSDRVLDGSFRACQGPFRERYKAIRDRADLIDMEVAAFYYFAPCFDTSEQLEYIAIKGSSNALGKGGEMNYFAPAVMRSCALQAITLLGLGGAIA